MGRDNTTRRFPWVRKSHATPQPQQLPIPATSFRSLCKARDWEELTRILQGGQYDLCRWVVLDQSTTARDLSKAKSPLHIMLRCKPPLFAVQALIKAWTARNRPPQELLHARDGRQSTLHIAAAHGCNPKVCQYLLSCAVPHTPDAQGRYPLHWACTYKPTKKERTDYIVVLDLLCSSCLDALVQRDVQGDTPRDVVRRSHCTSPQILLLLQDYTHQAVQQRKKAYRPPLPLLHDDTTSATGAMGSESSFSSY